jgi:hypothetical protein
MDMKFSGATLTYKYFDELLQSTQQTRLIQDESKRSNIDRLYAYIQDNDIWTKALPLTTEFQR